MFLELDGINIINLNSVERIFGYYDNISCRYYIALSFIRESKEDVVIVKATMKERDRVYREIKDILKERNLLFQLKEIDNKD